MPGNLIITSQVVVKIVRPLESWSSDLFSHLEFHPCHYITDSPKKFRWRGLLRHRVTSDENPLDVFQPEDLTLINMIPRFSILITLATTSLFMMASAFNEMFERVKTADGFLAALDQSGGSTPKALALYGITPDMYVEGEESMYQVIHDMRTRIMTSKAFTGERILGAILFENTMDRKVKDLPSSQYLWEVKNVVPFLKVDKGLQDPVNDVQLMKPIPGLVDLLKRAKENGVFGTKMRSVILDANPEGIKAIIDQQFEIGKEIIAAGLIPIIEPEVDIKSPNKAECEELLKANLLEHLNKLAEKEIVMLKCTIPTELNLYTECINHPNCLRVVALSGGYKRDEANKLLSNHHGLIASFSRGLTEGLTYQQTDEEFDSTLDAAIQSIYEASKSG